MGGDHEIIYLRADILNYYPKVAGFAGSVSAQLVSKRSLCVLNKVMSANKNANDAACLFGPGGTYAWA